MQHPSWPVVSMFALAAPAFAQCAAWVPEGCLGTSDGDQQVHVLKRWDPDGAGPQPEGIVCGGGFTAAGASATNRVAFWNPATMTFTALGTGVDATVRCAAVLASGELVVGGDFTLAGGQPAPGVARWDGTAWTPLGAGIVGQVFTLAVLPNGDLVAAGQFTLAGGLPCNHVARWDGSQWTALGSGTNNPVYASAVLSNGDLVVGGYFWLAGGQPVSHLARWNGAAWSNLAGGGVSFVVRALQVTSTGTLAVGGEFQQAGGTPASYAAVWDGIGWAPLGNLAAPVQALALDANGQLLAASCFPPIGTTASAVVRWSGSAWVPLAAASPTFVRTLAIAPGGDVLAGGSFSVVGAQSMRNLARCDGTSWVPMSRGIDGRVRALAVAGDGRLLAGGDFHHAGDQGAHYAARLDGVDWSPLGSGPGFPVHAIAGDANGHVFAADNGSNGQVAAWNGSAWSGLGIANGPIARLAMLGSELLAAGSFTSIGGVAASRLAVWNGTAWAAIAPGLSGTVSSLCVDPAGGFFVGGYALSGSGSPGSTVMHWNGSAWTSLGLAGTSVESLAIAPNGRLYAAGNTSLGTLVQWNGASWSAIPAGNHAWRRLAVLPNGDVIAGAMTQLFTTNPYHHIVRWNGSTATALGGGLTLSPSSVLFVDALAVSAEGRLFVGGNFLFADGVNSHHFATYASTCPASVAVGAAGCTGVHGTSSFTALDRPWLGATFHGRGTGLPPQALVVVGSGLTPLQLPVSLLLSPSPPACSFALQYDVADVQLVTGGTVDTALALPNLPAFAGTVLHQQLLTIGIDASLQFGESTVSNSLVATLGAF